MWIEKCSESVFDYFTIDILTIAVGNNKKCIKELKMRKLNEYLTIENISETKQFNEEKKIIRKYPHARCVV